MGNCDCNARDINENFLNSSNRLKLNDFCLLYPIGRGGFGRVWKVRLKRPYNPKAVDLRLQKNKSRIFAMKEMDKAKISLKKSMKSVANERKFLEKFNYNLLCNMYYAFQDEDTLYIIMDYLSGGDLRYHICRRNYFTEDETKFVAACITLSLNYIHEKNVIHRDIKPENLVFGGDGYLHLTDFGIAMDYRRGSTGVISASGTPGYMAPEAIINKPHDFAADYFALGVIVYELMLGERPYLGKNRKEIREQMFSLEIQLDNDDLPEDWVDDNIIDFINHLLVRKKKKRLGYKSDVEVKNHPYFKNIPWAELENMTFESPFVFDTEDNFDDSYAQKQDNDSIYEGNKELYIFDVNNSLIFKDFYFNIEDRLIQEKEGEKEGQERETKTRTHFTSKTSNKKIGDDSPIVIHPTKKNSRKSAIFKGIEVKDDNKVVKVMRKNVRSGSMLLNLNLNRSQE